MYDIAIIGAGVVGSLIARELAKYTPSVIVLEAQPDVATGASKANSGIVHAGYDAEPGSLKALLNPAGSRLMERTAIELGVPYRRNGSLVLAFNDDELATIKRLKERGEGNGVEGLSIIDGKTLREREPHLSQEAKGALCADTGAIVCPYELTVAAIGNAIDNGVILRRDFSVAAVEVLADHYRILAADDTVSARFVVNAAGLYSDQIAGLFGDHHIHITPRRGEYLLFDREVGHLVDHTIFQVPSMFGKGVLITPTVDGNLMVGPTAEDIEDKEDTRITEEGLARIIERGRRSLPSLPLGAIITSFAGLRAVSHNDDFVIEPSGCQPRVLHVAGIASPGLASSPAIARYAVEQLGKMGLPLKRRDDFDPIYRHTPRLKRLSERERAAYIAQNPRYGKIVCRCEEISEGEIVDAIRREPGAVDCDGIKRRVRCGMGRCQGGFCLPTVAEILSRERQIPLTAVTKCGVGSELLTGRTK